MYMCTIQMFWALISRCLDLSALSCVVRGSI